jgi:predicted amidohydrolase YtcJ
MQHLDLLVRNGRVFTVDSSKPWAEAIGVVGDRIAFVGSDSDAASLVGPGTLVVDAGGRLILPGLIDAHTHCLSAYQTYFWANLTPADTLGQFLDTVGKHAREHPDYHLVGGSGFRYSSVMKDGRLPDRKALDAAVHDRPVFLCSYDGWTACTNTKFLEIARARLGDAFEKIPGVEREPETGEPTGVFFKIEDLEDIVNELSIAGSDIRMEGLRLVIDDMVRWGVTGVHDLGARSVKDLETYDRLRRDGGLKLRVYVAIQHSRKLGTQQFPEFSEARSRYSDEWVRAGAVKLFIDGVEDSHTAAMLEPYADLPGEVGESIYPPEEFRDLVQELDSRGLHCITHSCGDRGVRIVLDAYENASERNSPRERRHRIEHVEMVSPEDIPRFHKLGVIPSMQPLHADLSAGPFDDVYGKTLGPERLERSFPWRGMVSSGARLTFSSDWPVADMNPFLGIHTAVTRGHLVGIQNTIGLEDAIRGYTINAAYSSFEDKLKGSLEVGKLADMVVVSDNLFEVPKEDIKRAKALLTIVGGKEVYRDPEFRG